MAAANIVERFPKFSQQFSSEIDHSPDLDIDIFSQNIKFSESFGLISDKAFNSYA